jgi:DNA-binding transcriptional ArsR family regulator
MGHAGRATEKLVGRDYAGCVERNAARTPRPVSDRAERAREAKQLREDGLTLRQVAEQLGVSPGTVSHDLRSLDRPRPSPRFQRDPPPSERGPERGDPVGSSRAGQVGDLVVLPFSLLRGVARRLRP